MYAIIGLTEQAKVAATLMDLRGTVSLSPSNLTITLLWLKNGSNLEWT